MFKVGDVIIRKDRKKERFKIVEIQYTVLVVETVRGNGGESSQYMINDGDKLNKYWEIDMVYLRKLKLEKICTRMGIV